MQGTESSNFLFSQLVDAEGAEKLLSGAGHAQPNVLASAFMRRSSAGVAVVLVLLVAGCSGGTKIAGSAVHQAGQVVGRDVSTAIELSADDVSRLADEARVGDDAIRNVAPELEQQSLWQRSLSEVGTVYQQTPEEVRSNLIGLACEGVTGQISSEDELWNNIVARFQGATQSELESFYWSTRQLWQDLYDARVSTDSAQQATAILTCYTVENVSG